MSKFCLTFQFFLKLEECLLKIIWNLFQSTRNTYWSKEITNQLVNYVSSLLNNTDLLEMKRDCTCSTVFLNSFIIELLRTAEVLSEGKVVIKFNKRVIDIYILKQLAFYFYFF